MSELTQFRESPCMERDRFQPPQSEVSGCSDSTDSSISATTGPLRPLLHPCCFLSFLRRVLRPKTLHPSSDSAPRI